jgi:hypothetical protein
MSSSFIIPFFSRTETFLLIFLNALAANIFVFNDSALDFVLTFTGA